MGIKFPLGNYNAISVLNFYEWRVLFRFIQMYIILTIEPTFDNLRHSIESLKSVKYIKSGKHKNIIIIIIVTCIINSLYFLQIGDLDEHAINLQHNHINTKYEKI